MVTVQDSLISAGAQSSDLEAILEALENDSIGHSREEEASGPFTELNPAVLGQLPLRLNVKRCNIVKMAIRGAKGTVQLSDKKDGADGELNIDEIKASAGGIVAGSSFEGMAAEGRVRKWGSNMVSVMIKGVSTDFTLVQLYLAPGESAQSATSGHIFMDNLRTIMHGLPVDVPIMLSNDVHAAKGEQLQRDVNDLSQKQFTAGATLMIWPGERQVMGSLEQQSDVLRRVHDIIYTTTVFPPCIS
ncbi:hypothetical protein ABBQ38_002740 [Trebouxia sp. C0009 RCD-2024]